MLWYRRLFSPGRTVLLSIVLTIVFGTLLLSLPIAQVKPISWLDCLFTATTSTCVTGVLTVSLNSFTLFGKCVILALIQIGGIGLITLTFFLLSLFTHLGLATKFMVGEIFELDNAQYIRRLLIFIIGFTFAIELIGTLLIYLIITPLGFTWFDALFHSVSSFCSAGLSVFSNNNMVLFANNLPMLIVTSILVLSGTLGFMVWYEFFSYLKSKWTGERHVFSLTTKVIVSMTVTLICCATLLLIILEGHRFGAAPWWTKVINMLFNAISYRSTGFTTIDLSTMQLATVFLIIMYSLIGSSPGSTGSGIRVTNLAIFLATVKSVIMGKTYVEIKRRTIANDQIFKAMAILSLAFCWIILSTFLLLLIEKDGSFIAIFFETVSSFTTLGLATEITPTLSSAGKILTMLNMFLGRVGSLTFLLALKPLYEKQEFKYPEERIMMG